MAFFDGPPKRDMVVQENRIGTFTWLDWFDKLYYAFSKLVLNKVVTTTVGAVTINSPTGQVNIAAGQTAIVVTNNLCNTQSLVFATVATNDATAIVKNCVAATGNFTIRLNAAATAQTAINFIMTN